MDNEQEYTLELPEIKIDNDPSEDFVDVVLKIVRDTCNSNTHTYDAYGFNNGTLVGLQIAIATSFENGIDINGLINNNAFTSKGVILKSVGKESDEFIKALSFLYGYPNEKIHFRRQVEATSFSQNPNSGKLDNKGEYKFKLFFNENDNELYSEIFLNINTSTGYIQFLEKDSKYRKSIVQNLGIG
jgi:hypothetical protein